MFLIDEISDTVKQLRKLDAQESSMQDAKKKEKNDNDYAKIVGELSSEIEKISEASVRLGFVPSDESIQIIEKSISVLEKVTDADVFDEEGLSSSQRLIQRKLMPQLSNEWGKFYQPKVSKTRAKLSSVGSLLSDKRQVGQIQKQISDAEEWTELNFKDDGTRTRLEQLESAIVSVDRIEDSLNLSDNVREFLELVTSGRANVTDLNTEIIEWIKSENLENKFTINFRN